MREPDARNLQHVCERARWAIADRLIDLSAKPYDATVAAEREELEEASRKLMRHEHGLS